MKEKLPQELQKKIKATLDDSCENLPARTLSKLRQARERALAHQAGKTSWWRSFILPVAGLATTAVAATFIAIIYFGMPNDISQLQSSVDDIELIITEEGPEFYSDLDFYTWLAEEQESAV